MIEADQECVMKAPGGPLDFGRKVRGAAGMCGFLIAWASVACHSSRRKARLLVRIHARSAKSEPQASVPRWLQPGKPLAEQRERAVDRVWLLRTRVSFGLYSAMAQDTFGVSSVQQGESASLLADPSFGGPSIRLSIWERPDASVS